MYTIKAERAHGKEREYRKLSSCHPDLNTSFSRQKLSCSQTGKVFRFLKEITWKLCAKNGDISVQFSVLELLQKLKLCLHHRRVKVLRDGIRIVGSVATSLLESAPMDEISVNDLDINVYLDPEVTNDAIYFQILQAEEEALQSIIEEQTGQLLSLKEIFDNFFVEMVMVNQPDSKERWSLLSIGMHNTIDIKFVQHSLRSYAFSVDSVEIILSPFLTRSPNQSQDVFFESLYGNAVQSLRHINMQLIKAKQPEKIRRGIFRFCLELAKGRRCETEEEHKRLQAAFIATFLEEFYTLPDHGMKEFKAYLQKFLSKHLHQALPILTKLYYTLTSSLDNRAQLYLTPISELYQKMTPK